VATKRSRVFDSHEPPGFDLRSGILETAKALGMSPVDLATLIHYESGLDPNVWGGAGGRHYGSIQFGPTERAQYGVRVGDPSSQFGPEGAIVKYMLDRGFKPGMSILDAYSTVNAGQPGLYNASDVAAGGDASAPTVRDKVTKMLGGNRKAAMEFLGMSAENYDPRADTPSTGHPVGSTLPGPPPDPYAQPATGGGGGASTVVTADPARDSRFNSQKMGEAMASGEGMGDIKGTTVPDLPRAALFQSQPTTVGDPQEVELRKKKLAEIMMRLNSGKLTL
jgi:hypothetical protein